ncbi:MAG: tyrosine--tRNA ligase [Candidatus Nanoarchaeia archaeon]|nr:tyrosine--tRNA ligase [Candidatus Nanoarchaeia archaeon]
MNVDERFNLVKSVGEEIITESELKELISKNKKFTAYDGFEPSGVLHIAQGLMRAINVNKFTKAGAKFKLLVADWHAAANNKYNGDLDVIKKVGDYFVEVWKASGMDLDNVEFVYVSDLVKNPEYWKLVLKISMNSTLNRMIRCCQIMGRCESEALKASQILYPCMQCADIFHLGVDVCQLGMDQRKVNVLARELAESLGYKKPVAVHTHMLAGLGKPPGEELKGVERAIAMKMSKSKPETAIFMLDSEKEVNEKISKAYCPEKEIKENPVIEYCKYIIFEKYPELKIERPQKFGGDVVFSSYEELAKEYSKGKIHPLDLKKSVSFYINEMMSPVRKHFEKNKKAKELYEFVQSQKITR